MALDWQTFTFEEWDGFSWSEWEGFVAVEGASGTVTEEQRESVAAWLAGDSRILESSVGPLTEVDADRPL